MSVGTINRTLLGIIRVGHIVVVKRTYAESPTDNDQGMAIYQYPFQSLDKDLFGLF